MGSCGFVRVFLGILSLVYFGLALPAHAETQTGSSREYQIKSALVFNFLKFIDWPKESDSPSNSKERRIALIADNDICNTFKIIHGKTVNGKTVRIQPFLPQQIEDPNILYRYDVVYITAMKSSPSLNTNALLQALNQRPILTVGETPPFLERGGMINFVYEKNNIHFEINLYAMQQKGFSIKAQLLRLAKRVRKKPPRG